MADTALLDDGVDGDTATGESASSPNGMLGVYVSGGIDLGAPTLVDEVRITGCAISAGGYQVWYSNTDTNPYSAVGGAFPGFGGCQQNIETFAPISARYWRASIVDQEPGDGPVEATITDFRLFYLGNPVMPGGGSCVVPDIPTLAGESLLINNIPTNRLTGS